MCKNIILLIQIQIKTMAVNFTSQYLGFSPLLPLSLCVTVRIKKDKNCLNQKPSRVFFVFFVIILFLTNQIKQTSKPCNKSGHRFLPVQEEMKLPYIYIQIYLTLYIWTVLLHQTKYSAHYGLTYFSAVKHDNIHLISIVLYFLER